MKYRSKKEQKLAAIPVSRLDTCSWCGGTFNWQTGGTVNANGEIFCTDKCFDAKRHNKPASFEEL